MKLNAKLAQTDHHARQWKAMLEEYNVTFKNKQTIFQGIRKLFIPSPGQEDDPKKSGTKPVQSTVSEYLLWLEGTSADYIDARFSIEATNATGPKAELMVEGKSLGVLSSVELMRLNDLLNSPELAKMYAILPVRSDLVSWKLSENVEFKDKGIWETEERSQLDKTTIKSSRILLDPNISNLKNTQNYTPVTVPDDTLLTYGTQTEQYFSGEISHRDRAEILRRYTILKAAVKAAIVEANNIEVVTSMLDSKKLFSYLHRGTI